MTLAIFLLMLSIALNPTSPMQGANGAVKLCISSVIPSLLPVLVLNNLLLSSGALDRSFGISGKIFSKLFRLPPVALSALASGILSGYPSGAKAAWELYTRGAISHAQYSRLIAFCNCAGPAFITGTVGTALLGSPSTGKILLAIHIISAVLVGIVFRFCQKDASLTPIYPPRKKRDFSETFTCSVEAAVDTVAKICGYIIFFGMLMSEISPLLSEFPPVIQGALYGFFEMTGGIAKTALSDLHAPLRCALVSAILAWGGICIHMQSMKYIKNKKTYLAGKALQGIISFILTYIFFKLSSGKKLCPAFTTPSRLSLALLLSVLVFYLIFAAVPRRASRSERPAS